MKKKEKYGYHQLKSTPCPFKAIISNTHPPPKPHPPKKQQQKKPPKTNTQKTKKPTTKNPKQTHKQTNKTLDIIMSGIRAFIFEQRL